MVDPDRFARDAEWAWRWRAVLDWLGPVLLFTDGGRHVASFLVRRDRAAAWAPGGAFWGAGVAFELLRMPVIRGHG